MKTKIHNKTDYYYDKWHDLIYGNNSKKITIDAINELAMRVKENSDIDPEVLLEFAIFHIVTSEDYE